MPGKKVNFSLLFAFAVLFSCSTAQAAKVFLATVDLLPFGSAYYSNLRAITEKFGLVHSEIIIADSFDPTTGKFSNISRHWSWGYSLGFTWQLIVNQAYGVKWASALHIMNEINSGRAIQVMEAVNLTPQLAWTAAKQTNRYTQKYFYQVLHTNCNRGCTYNLLLAQALSKTPVNFRILKGLGLGCGIEALRALGSLQALPKGCPRSKL